MIYDIRFIPSSGECVFLVAPPEGILLSSMVYL